MGKVLGESPITTRNARASLPDGLHWRRIDADVHLGYRKSKRAGSWLVRWRVGQGYRQAGLGTADDAIKEGNLSYDSALKAAREHVEKARADALAEASGEPMTVRSAIESYIAGRDARDARRAGRDKRSDAASRLSLYVIGRDARGKRKAAAAAPIAEALLHRLTERDLARWREGLPTTLKATTTRRLLNDMRAALNAAYSQNRERLPATFSGAVKHALRTLEREDDAEPVARDNQILSDADIGRTLKAARAVDAQGGYDGDLFRLLLALAATGARFSQLARMRVRDLQADQARLLVPSSRKGRGGAKVHYAAVPIGADVVAELSLAAVGRDKDAPLLERWTKVQKPGGVAWHRDRREGWKTSSEIIRPWGQIREIAGLPDAVPYALRHTSIVRAIKANLPLRLVASLHDTSTAMIERHYAKWISHGLEDVARAAIGPLVPGDDAKVIRLPGRDR